MADIFISYASEDRDRVIPIVKALEDQGWSTFWDWESIPVGKTWRGVIDEGLETSRCILVMWSTISTTKRKRWVLEEADFGLEREILIPALLDDVRPPRGFGQIQAAKLINWTGEINNAEFKKLVGALESILGSSPRHVRESEQTTETADVKTKQVELKPTEPRIGVTKELKKVLASKIGALITLAFVVVVGGAIFFLMKESANESESTLKAFQNSTSMTHNSLEPPRPNIILLASSEDYEAGGKQWKRYKLVVTNWASYSGDLFTPSPALPPCGLNKNSSRTWVEIYDALKKQRIYGLCALTSAEDLNGIWFSIEKEKSPPEAVYVILEDRREGKKYISDTVEVKTAR